MTAKKATEKVDPIPVRFHEYRVTFGQRYRTEDHPLFPDAHPEGWLTVLAESASQARWAAFAFLGDEWGFLYEPVHYNDNLADWGRWFPQGELGRINADDYVHTEKFELDLNMIAKWRQDNDPHTVELAEGAHMVVATEDIQPDDEGADGR